MVQNIRPDDYVAPWEYIPPAKFKSGDKVTLSAHPVAFGFPLDYDSETVLTVTKDSFHVKRGWTATVKYGKHNYEVYEEALEAVNP